MTSQASSLRLTDPPGTDSLFCYILLYLWKLTLQRMKREIHVFSTCPEKFSSVVALPLQEAGVGIMNRPLLPSYGLNLRSQKWFTSNFPYVLEGLFGPQCSGLCTQNHRSTCAHAELANRDAGWMSIKLET